MKVELCGKTYATHHSQRVVAECYAGLQRRAYYAVLKVEHSVERVYKFAKAGFTAERSEFVNAPLIKELPFTLECEFVSYDEESNHLVGRIVNVSADERILTEGQIDLAKLRPITYDPINHNYIELGTKVGNAFADGKKLK